MELASLSPAPALSQRHRRGGSRQPLGALGACPLTPLVQQVQQVKQVCDRVLATLRADGCFIEQAQTVAASAHALACWRGATIVLKADGPTPDLRLPRAMPLLALELWSGTLAIVYHADLTPARQTIGILHVLAHFLLLWDNSLQAGACLPTDYITCAYHFLPSQERLQDAGSDAVQEKQENAVVQELTWTTARPPRRQRSQRMQQHDQSASHRRAPVGAATPERAVGSWESDWEPYAIELTRRLLSPIASEPTHL